MAYTKADLKAEKLKELEKEQKQLNKQKESKKKEAAKKAETQQKVFENKEKNDLIGAKDNHKLLMEDYDFSPSSQKREKQISESIAAKTTPTVSAKAISSEAEKKPMSATQYGKTQLSNQIYDKYRTIEKYYNDPTGNSLEKGLVNRLRSAGGETVENVARFIDDNISDNPEERIFNSKVADFLNTNAKNVIAKNTAGQIGDLADQQIMQAKENTGAFGDFLIDTADAGANMASQAILAGVLLPGAPAPVANKIFGAVQGVSTGAQKYVDTREAGGSKAEALQRGIGSGAIAAITEGLTGIGKTGVSKIPGVDRVVTHLDEFATKNWLTNVLSTALGEGGEEGLEYAFEYASDVVADLIYKGEIETDFNVADLFQNVASGFVLGAGFGTVNYNPDAKPVGTDTVAEQPVSPAEAPIAEAENVTPETANEQKGAFANAGERIKELQEERLAVEITLKNLEKQNPDIAAKDRAVWDEKLEQINNEIESIVREVSPEALESNAQVNSTNDAIEPANDVIKQANAQARAQENIPQETATPKSKIVVDPESEMEYVSEEDYDGARTNGNFGKNTVGSAQLNNTFYKSLDKFGAQPLRKEQIASGNEMRVPKKISENEAITENVGYMLGSKLADNDYMDDVIQHPEKYAHIINTDANSMQNAVDYIQNNGLDETYGAWRKTIDEHKMVEKDDISKAYLLGLFYQNKAKNETDPVKKDEYRKRALDIKTDINYAASKGGQLLQGIQMLQKAVDLDSINLKEDGEYMANRLVEKLNADRNGKGKEIVLNKKLVDKAIEAAGTDAEGKAWDEVYKDLANQTSTSFWQRVNNYRYWCMLSNPRTHVRNIMSNVSMAIVNAVKDATAKPIVEGLFNAYAKNRSNKAVELDSKIKQLIVDQNKTGAKGNSAEIEKLKKRAERLHGFDNARKKTVAFYSPKNLKFAFDDFKTAKLIFDKSAGKYQENTNNFIKEHKTNQNALIEDRLAKKIEGNTKAGKAIKTILEHGVFGSVMDFNSWLLTDVEDGSFKAITYAHELLQRMSANGITPETASRPENIKKMDELRADAFAEALYNTFNEDSKTADALRKLEETGVIPHVVVESLLPFKKVPVNIIKTGRDYSPIGVAKGIGEMAKVLRDPKAGDPGKAINDIAKGLTGLELMALGGFLRSIGKITNGLSDDENEKNYQKLLGEQAFALKFSDGSSYTIDWLGAPVMPLFVGALIQDMKEGKLKEKIDFKKEDGSFDFEEAISVFGGGAVGVLSSIANPMIEMSMLQNIEYTLTSQYNSLGDFATDAFGNYANQFVPQVLAAITKVKDNTKRNAYYVDKTDKMSDVFQVPVQVAMSKIPGVAEKLPEKVDAWGRTQTHSDRDTQLGWAFDAFISPGTYKKDKTTQADRFLLSAFNGDASVMPKMQQKYFNIEKQRKDLSAQEYVDLQKEYGKQAQTLINQLIPNKATFNKLPDELQYKVIDDVYSYASQKGKEKVTLGEARRYVADKWVSDAEKYAKEDGKPITQTIMERKVIGQYPTKDEQMAALQKTFGLSGEELHESFYKATGGWYDDLEEYVDKATDAKNEKTRQARLDAFERRKWSDEDVLAGYNGLMGYGNAKKAEQIAILTKVFGSKAKATEFYNIKEGNKGYK